MTGPEHYHEAERLIELAQHPRYVVSGVGDVSAEDIDRLKAHFGDETLAVFSEPAQIHDMTLAAAQVHATLALTAATAADKHNMVGRSEWYGAVQS